MRYVTKCVCIFPSLCNLFALLFAIFSLPILSTKVCFSPGFTEAEGWFLIPLLGWIAGFFIAFFGYHEIKLEFALLKWELTGKITVTIPPIKK